MQELGEIRVFLLDMDGTIKLGGTLLPGARDFLDYLKVSGREFLFLTNNSSKDSQHYVEKMCGLGIECQTENVLTSGDATITYLAEKKKQARVFCWERQNLSGILFRPDLP